MVRTARGDEDEAIEHSRRSRTMNPLIASLPWPRTARVRCVMQPLSVTLAEMALVPIEAPAAKDPEPHDCGHCGWLDSSLDLADGLDVIEYLDQLPDDLVVEGLLWPGGRV
jgi:hypothetical protein